MILNMCQNNKNKKKLYMEIIQGLQTKNYDHKR